MPENVVIVGAGHAAGQVVATLRHKGFAGHITLIGEEPWYPYQRPPLSKKFLAGELPAERLYFKPPAFYDDPRISVRLETRVESIDRAGRSLLTSDGDTETYDKLVLATGARPRHIDLPGAELDGVHYLRTIGDVEGIRGELRSGSRLAIVGAGYIGLEVAAVAATLGAKVTVIEMQDRVMSRVVSPPVSAFYADEHRRHGVGLLMSAHIERFVGDGHVDGVLLGDDDRVDTDLVIVGVGVVPNIELASAAGLAVEDGIVVDDRCRTADPNIYAVGDCTRHPNALLGRQLRLESVHNALEQGKTAASNICGEDVHYSDIPWFWSDQYDLKLQIAGLSTGYDDAIIRGDMAARSFSCVYLRDGILIAIDAINRPKDFMQAKSLIAAHAVIEPQVLADADIELRNMEFAGRA
jgi:3-phenylpropionate/trans-cinnamate dioxygenase ferredoxin reductase subunit